MTKEHPPADSSIDAVCAGILRMVSVSPVPVRRVRMNANGVEVELEWSADITPPAAAAPTGPGPASPEAPHQAAVSVEAGLDQHLVLAPLVGTFYHAPEPGAASFVAKGDTVQVGQQVALIEVMKMMVPVEADRAGSVIEHLVPNGEPVEYGQPLLSLTRHTDH